MTVKVSRDLVSLTEMGPGRDRVDFLDGLGEGEAEGAVVELLGDQFGLVGGVGRGSMSARAQRRSRMVSIRSAVPSTWEKVWMVRVRSSMYRPTVMSWKCGSIATSSMHLPRVRSGLAMTFSRVIPFE